MKRLIFAMLLFAGLLPAGQPIFRAQVTGADHAYQGHDFWVSVGTTWYNAEPMTINIQTDEVTVNTTTYPAGTQLSILSAGTLPSAINSFLTYDICSPSSDGHTFKLAISGAGCGTAANPSTVDFTDVGSGQIYAGLVIGGGEHGPAVVYLKEPILPWGVTKKGIFNSTGGEPPLVAKGYHGGDTYFSFRILLNIAAGSSIDPRNLTFTVEQGGQTVTLNHTFTPKVLTAVTIRRPTSFPPVPNKANWQNKMTQLAAKWCPDRASGTLNPPNLSFGLVGSQVWEYDGAWVYEQIARYTGDASWRNCAQSIRSQYRNHLIGPPPRVSHAFFYWTDGFAAVQDSVAIKYMADTHPYTHRGGSIGDSGTRETAYLLETSLNAALSHGYTSIAMIPTDETTTWPRIRRNIEWSSTMLLSNLDKWRGNKYIYQQTYQIGLTLHALIRYWEFSQDERVPPEILVAVSYIWNDLWLAHQSEHPNKLLYNISPRGAKCAYQCSDQSDGYTTSLINLTVPVFAWMYSITGSNAYQIIGDQMWSHALDTDFSSSGRAFSQNYRWSFDYVRWREGLQPYRP